MELLTFYVAIRVDAPSGLVLAHPEHCGAGTLRDVVPLLQEPH